MDIIRTMTEPQNQCKNVGNAYVTLSITHSTVAPPPPSAAPFDLVWDNEDDNGFPLNAKWGWQTTTSRRSP